MKNKLADKIHIHDLQVPTIIGVYPQERVKPQSLVLSLTLSCDIQRASETDDLAYAIDYAAVSDAVLCFAEKHQFNLIETFADRLASELIASFSLAQCELTVRKQPFDMPFVSGVSVQIVRP